MLFYKLKKYLPLITLFIWIIIFIILTVYYSNNTLLLTIHIYLFYFTIFWVILTILYYIFQCNYNLEKLLNICFLSCIIFIIIIIIFSIIFWSFPHWPYWESNLKSMWNLATYDIKYLINILYHKSIEFICNYINISNKLTLYDHIYWFINQ